MLFCHNECDNAHAISVDDISLVPGKGILSSRSHARMTPFLINAPMDTVSSFDLVSEMVRMGEYATVSRFMPPAEYEKCVNTFHTNPDVFFAISASCAEYKTYKNLVDASLCYDVAHGYSNEGLAVPEFLRKAKWRGANLMSGSLCTYKAASALAQAGYNFLRVGIGSGSACTTRRMTGVGVPTLQAVIDVVGVAHAFRAKVVADGGIREPGDAAKYLAAGADAIMMGRVFSRVVESPGWDAEGFKAYRGQASAEFQNDIYGHVDMCPEGVALPKHQKNSKLTTETIIESYRRGISSMISYLGCDSLDDVRGQPIVYVIVTSNGHVEGLPHGLHS